MITSLINSRTYFASLLSSQTYFDCFRENYHILRNASQRVFDSCRHNCRTTKAGSSVVLKSRGIANRIFSLCKLIPAPLYLTLGTVLWIKEYIQSRLKRTQAIARENRVESANQVMINKFTPIQETFITFPYLEISRLGDYAKFYLNAKWVARQLGAPLIIRPFPHSAQLKIGEKRYQLESSLKTQNFTQLSIEQLEKICRGELKKEDLGSGIFTVPYFWEWTPTINWPEHADFQADYLNDFMPANHIHIPLVEPIAGKVNVAIQVRDGGSFDNLEDKFLYPLRFPDLSYYEAQLEYVLQTPECQNQPVNIHIFTDAVNPASLKTRFQAVLERCGRAHDVTITCRSEKIKADEATLSDLISMSHYPIVIRARSCFSDLATFLGRPKLEIYPEHGNLTQEGVCYIDKVKILRRGQEEESAILADGMYAKQWPQNQHLRFAFVYKAFHKT